MRNVEDDDDDSDGDTGNRNLPFSGGKCDKCDSFKPLRAHHCSVCGKCVLKMDHHCRKWREWNRGWIVRNLEHEHKF